MSAEALRRGWCPALLDPMPSGDGWLVRVKPSTSTLSSVAARSLAAAARSEGSGQIDLTSRANLQIRGLSPQSAQSFAEEMIAQHLASPDACVERIRNILVSPLGPDDASAAFDSHAVAREIEAMLVSETDLQRLPAKFGFLVDGGGKTPLRGIATDIMVRGYEGELAISLHGSDLAAPCGASQVVSSVRALARAFLELSAGLAEGPNRMRAVVMRSEAHAVFACAGLKSVRLPSDVGSMSRKPPIGVIATGHMSAACGVGLPFGRMDAATLMELAELAERFGDGTLRMTPWRTVLLADIEQGRRAELLARLASLPVIVDADDARLAIFACVGSAGCANASVETREVASQMAKLPLARHAVIHISGCCKGCAHPAVAGITLTGHGGRYDLVQNGKAGGAAVAAALTAEEALARVALVRPGSKP